MHEHTVEMIPPASDNIEDHIEAFTSTVVVVVVVVLGFEMVHNSYHTSWTVPSHFM